MDSTKTAVLKACIIMAILVLTAGLVAFIHLSVFSEEDSAFGAVASLFGSGKSVLQPPLVSTKITGAVSAAPLTPVEERQEASVQPQDSVVTVISTTESQSSTSGSSSSSRSSSSGSGSSSSSSSSSSNSGSPSNNDDSSSTPEDDSSTSSSSTSPASPSQIDLDNDDYTQDVDCNENDPSIYPGAEEIPYDDIDQDCDGEDLVDVDGDGYIATQAGGDDCQDLYEEIHPGAAEIPLNGLSDDCETPDNLIFYFGPIIRFPYNAENPYLPVRVYHEDRLYYPLSVTPDQDRVVLTLLPGSTGRARVNIGGINYELSLTGENQIITEPLPVWQD